MKKGSIVKMKEEGVIGFMDMFRMVTSGLPIPDSRSFYVVADDSEIRWCEGCGGYHEIIELEEYPNFAFDGEDFEEVPSIGREEVRTLLNP